MTSSRTPPLPDIDVLVENHFGLSSDARLARAIWCGSSIRRASARCRTSATCRRGVDRYEAVRKMMPYAKAVSAKCYDFDDAGNETTIDFGRMMRIVTDAGYRGNVGIEYEGTRLPEREGIARLQAAARTVANVTADDADVRRCRVVRVKSSARGAKQIDSLSVRCVS